MSLSSEQKDPYITAEMGDGSVVSPVYVVKKLTVYAIHEHEADSLANFSTFATIAFSSGSFLLSLGGSMILNYENLQGTPSAVQEVLGKEVSVGVIILSIFAFIIGGILIHKRTGMWNKITAQSSPRA